MTQVLLTTFEPFGGESLNPSLETGRLLARESIEGVTLKLVELPVNRHRAIEVITPEILSAPDVVIMLGEAGGRHRIMPERVAVNVDDFRISDNAGNQPSDEPIVEGGPAAYFSTLPNRAIVNRLIEKRIPAAISNSAGTFLCNRVFYSVMHLIDRESLRTRAGFIHLPYLPEQTVLKSQDFPCLPRDTMVEAILTAIEVSAGVLRGVSA
jgi:pyroglutamyl-peptidase